MPEQPSSEQGRVELAETFADVARTLLSAGSVDEALTRICRAAVDIVGGCDHAGISLIVGRSITTRGASDDVPHAVDAIQYEVDDGPCLHAIREEEVVHVDDLANEKRWPLFAQRTVDETRVRSMLSFRLFADADNLGALNLYSRVAGAFDAEADHVGAVLAAHAAVAMAAAMDSYNKDEALRSRDVIGQAKGILMARQNISEAEAFDLLRRASQRMNIKLRDIADAVATGRPVATTEPDDHR